MAFDATLRAGTTSKIIEVMIRSETTGQGVTGLAHGSVTASYCREGGTRTAITLASGTVGDAYSSGKWAQVDSTNTPGLYQLHLPNAALASGAASVSIFLKAAGTIDKVVRINLLGADLYDAIRAGLSALPNANASATGGLPTVDSNNAVRIQSGTGTGQLSFTAGIAAVNVAQFGGSAGTFAGGRPEVNATHWGGTAVGSANVRSNVVQVAGQAASASAGVTFPASIGTSTLDAAQVRSAVGLASANLDTQLGAIDTVVDSVLVHTGRMDGLIENVGGDRFTQKALEQGPVSTGGDSAADIYTYFTASNRQDVFKADISGLLTTTAFNARIPSAITITGGRVASDVERWRGTQPGTLDSNGFVPGNLAAINGNTTRAGTLSTWIDNNRLDVAVSTVGGDSAADIYTYFTSSNRQDTFRADVSSLATTAQLNARTLAAADYATAAAVAALPSAGAIAIQVDSTLSAAHGAGSWTTATGFALAATAPSWWLAPVDVSADVSSIKAKTDQLVFVEGKVEANATAVIDESTVSTLISGTTQGVVAGLGSARITVRSPLSPRGKTLTIRPGDDYFATDRAVPEWEEEAAGWPVLTGAAITLSVNGGTLGIAGSVVVATGSNKKVRVEMTAAQSIQIQQSPYELLATLPGSGHVVTLAKGMVITE